MTKDKNKPELSGIGMRIVKSAVAVAVCYFINELRGGHGIVFYSQLAALWCIQMYQSNTVENALQRTIGTIVGALYGLLYVLVYPDFIAGEPGWMEGILVSLMIVVVLYTTVLLKKRQASYLSDDYPGYAYIKIYNQNATKENMIMYLKQMTKADHVVTFGTIPGQYDVCIHTEDANKVVREVRKRYEPVFK